MFTAVFSLLSLLTWPLRTTKYDRIWNTDATQMTRSDSETAQLRYFGSNQQVSLWSVCFPLTLPASAWVVASFNIASIVWGMGRGVFWKRYVDKCMHTYMQAFLH